MKVKDLFNFEQIQDVIEIGKIQNEQELVEKYVISPALEEEILDLLDVLKAQKHKSVNVIGNYGTGKSHLLGLLSLVLSDKGLIKFIQSDKVRKKLEEFNREFIIIKYELPATQSHALGRIFFYRVRKQLKDNYGIEIRNIKPDDEDKDIKELVEEILLVIKEKAPTKGLLVIFDEFSDFLKQKQTIDRNHDLQVYRQLGECSNSMDFMFMVSMQEYIFSNPKYVDQADSIARTQQRYKDIHITNESVEEMIAKRVVSKDSNQEMELRKLFKDIEHYFSNLSAEQDKYVKLFPVHPYVIEVFSLLPFFEKRGIIQFLSHEIKNIMDEIFPQFITYERIYDSIDRVLSIRNHPDVKPVVDAVDTLKTKIDLLEPKLKKTALKSIKALAIMHLIKSSNKNGATAQELANTLFLIPSNNILNPVDDIERILDKLRKVSDGQFINKTNDGVYFLDLKQTQDYDIIIQNKISNIDDPKEINQCFVENFLLNELDVEYSTDQLSYFDTTKKYVLPDSAYWEDRKSFRKGTIAINIGYELEIEAPGDYIFTILGYAVKKSNLKNQREIVVKIKYDDDFVYSMKKLAAIEEFLKTKTYTQVMMSKKRNVIDKELRPKFSKLLLNAEVSYQNKKISITEDLGISSDISIEIVKQIKQNILNEEFTKEFPDYPKLKSQLTAENIRGILESILKDIAQKQGIVENLLNQSANILIPLDLYKDNSINVSDSIFADKILKKLSDSSKNVPIESIIKLFTAKPYGLQVELIQLIIAVLLRNGDILLSSKKGEIYSSSDFSHLFRFGLQAFDEFSYIKKEEALNVSQVQLLFAVIDVDGSLLQTAKDRPIAYRNYIDKIDSIERDLRNISDDFERIKQAADIGLPLGDIGKDIESIVKVEYANLKVNSLNEFKKLDYSKSKLDKIKKGYNLLSNIKQLFEDYFDHIKFGIGYMKHALEILESEYFKETEKKKLFSIYDESVEIISNHKKLLKADERRPLQGKIDEFKRKYKELYYHTHNDIVGSNIDWELLSEIDNSSEKKKLDILRNIKCVNPLKYTEILLKLQNLKEIKCLDFNVDDIDNHPVCPHCNFPNRTYDPNINATISSLENELKNILQSWELSAYTEIENNKQKVKILNHQEKRIIQNIISQGYLPKDIDDEIVDAINSLLEDLEIIEVDLNELYKSLTSDSDVLKIEDFKDKIEEYMTKIVESGDSENIRLKIKK